MLMSHQSDSSLLDISLYWGELTRVGFSPVYLGMALIFTDYNGSWV